MLHYYPLKNIGNVTVNISWSLARWFIPNVRSVEIFSSAWKRNGYIKEAIAVEFWKVLK